MLKPRIDCRKIVIFFRFFLCNRVWPSNRLYRAMFIGGRDRGGVVSDVTAHALLQ